MVFAYVDSMRFPYRASRLWPLALLLMFLLPATQVHGLTHYWGKHPDKERLVIVFDDAIPAYAVRRTEQKSITLTLPPEYWQTHDKPQANTFGSATLLRNVVVIPEGLRIDLKTNAFGYIQFPLDDRGKLVVDIFPDPIGAKWKPEPEAPATPPPAPTPREQAAEEESFKPGSALQKLLEQRERSAQMPTQPAGPLADEPVSAQPQPTPQPETLLEPQPEPLPAPEPGIAPPATPDPTPQPATQPEPTAIRQPGPEAVDPRPQSQIRGGTDPGRPGGFFSVPYSYRAPISRSGPQELSNDSEPLPQPDLNTPPPPALPRMPQDRGDQSDAGTSPLAAATAQTRPEQLQTGLQRLLEGTHFGIALAHAQEQEGLRQTFDPEPTPQPDGSVQAGPEEGGDFTLRATMAPKDQTLPAPVQRIGPRPAPQEGPAEHASTPLPAEMPELQPEAPEATPEIQAETQPDAQHDVQPEVRVQVLPEALPRPEAAEALETPPALEAEQPEQTEQAAAPDAPDAPPALEPAVQADAPAGEESAVAGQPEQPEPDRLQAEEPSVEELLELQKELAGKGAQEPEGPNFEETLLSGRAALANEDYDNALEILTGLKQHANLPKDMVEDVLYNLAEALYALHRQNLRENYSRIVNAYTEAMNNDLESMRVPEALFKLGLLNLKVDNPREAEAYFNILKRKYPDDERVPLTHYYWGEYHFDRNDFQRAADEFQYIVQKFPDNRFVREASVGLARSLHNLGYAEQSQEIVDYIEKRWPRYYVQFPPLLRLFGDVNYKAGMKDQAKLHYWTYYNLDPDGEDADIVLARLGDIYLDLGDTKTAKELYEMTVERFPNREGGLIAQMRLAEQGVYDAPTIADMFSVFDRPYTLQPVQVYERIVKEFPNSELAPLAQVKLAMWHLWNKRYRESLEAAQDFRQKFPGNALMDNAKTVAMQAYSSLVLQDLREENYRSVVNLWESNNILTIQEELLPPETRIGLATGLWKTGSPDKGRRLLDPFFLSPAMPEQAENALMLAMSICLDTRDWRCLTDLAERTELWEISPVVRETMDYNLALAYENLGESDKSAPLWGQLAQRQDMDPKQMAYVSYFLAHEARDKDDFKRAFDLAQDSLTFFLDQREELDKIKDLLALLMDITHKTDRTRESLRWAIEYARYINRNDPEWPALRYRMALLYRELADIQKWRAILQELEKDMPHTLYGRMASSDLKTQQIEQGARQFAPTGRM